MRPSLRALCALVALAAAGLAAPAAAQTETAKLNNTPAEKFIVAPGGVDMRTGRYVYNETDLSIGGEGNGGLTLTRTLTSNAPNGHFPPFASLSHNWDIMVTESQSRTLNERNEYDRFAHVNFGGRSQTFPASKVSGSALAQVSSGIAQSLSFEGSRGPGGVGGNVVYTYTAADGTVASFRPLGNDCGGSCAYVTQITEPDGTRFSFDYESADGVSNGRMRLTRVTSSRGYALILEGSGYFVNKACVVNLAKTGAASSCPAGVPTAAYEYVTLGKTRLAKVTGPDDSVSRFTYPVATEGGTVTGYFKPGYETPWMTIATQVLGDELGVPQDVVQRQDFADGQSYSYGIESGPLENSGRAGGWYTNGLGEHTEVKFDWPREPGQNTPGSLCRRLPCAPVEVDAQYSWVYQQTPGPVSIVDPLGNTTRFDYCEEAPMRLLPGNILDRCIVFGAPLVVTDPEGIVTEFKYDNRLNAVEAKKRPRPGVLNPDGSVPAPIVTSAVYDNVLMSKSANKPLSMTDARGFVTNWTYAPEHGGVRTETGPAVGGVTPQKRYSYVQRHARLADGSPAGPLVWLPDSVSTCRTGNPSGAGCVLGAGDEMVTRFDYGPDSASSNLLLRGQSVTADGRTLRTCFAYDGLGRKISETSPNGTAGLSACPAAAPTAALPYTSSIRYDSGNKVTGTISADPDGAGWLPAPAVRNSYDPAGRLIRVEQGALSAWQPDNVPPALWPGFTAYKIIDSSFDALDRKTREAVIGAGVTEYGYDLAGRLRCTAVRMNPDAWATPLADKCVPGPAHPVHGFDRISMIVYDKAGRPIESWDAVGTPLQRREAAWAYNANGQKTSLTDARGFRAEMKYDGFDRQQRWVFPSKASPGVADQSDYEEYRYDPDGNRTSLRKRDGAVLLYTYDSLDRMVIKETPGNVADVRYSYDLRGLQTAAWFTSTDLGIFNAYDGFGRLISSRSTMGGASRTISFLYDSDGNRVRITHPDSFFTYQYDGLNRFVRVLEDGWDPLVAFAYDPAGRRSGLTRGGTASAFGYDPAGRLDSLRHDLAGTAGDQTIGLTYNPAGQILGRSGANDAFAWTGGVAADRPYSVNGQNQYTAAGPASFSYDANGNLTSDGSTTFVYDSENRLVSASGAKNATLSYDPLGRLWQVSSPATGTTRFLYDGDALADEYDGAGTLLRRYIHGADSGADDPLIWYEHGVAGWRRALVADQQGSIIAIADRYGNPIAINTYDEYGIPGAAQTAPASLSSHGRFQYTGQAWIPELGMYYYKARIYSPTLGRFLQVDPIGYDDQVNLYAYVGNDPLNKVDPSGNGAITVGKWGRRIYRSKGNVGGATRETVKELKTDWHALDNDANTTGWQKLGAAADLILGTDLYSSVFPDKVGDRIKGDLPGANEIGDDERAGAIEELGASIEQRTKEMRNATRRHLGSGGSPHDPDYQKNKKGHQIRIDRETKLKEELETMERVKREH
jgi:RHS repeat-associated protein